MASWHDDDKDFKQMVWNWDWFRKLMYKLRKVLRRAYSGRG